MGKPARSGGYKRENDGNMKKFIGIILALIILTASLFALSACKEKAIIYGTVVDQYGNAFRGCEINIGLHSYSNIDEFGKFQVNYAYGEDYSKFIKRIKVKGNFKSYEVKLNYASEYSMMISIIVTVEERIGFSGDNVIDDRLLYLSDGGSYYSKTVTGKVIDKDYRPVAGLGLYFGLAKKPAATTSQTGEFSFTVNNESGFKDSRVLDYISLADNEDTDYRIMEKTNDNDPAITCLIVLDRGQRNTNIFRGALSVYFKCTFDQDGIKLPKGYVSKDTVYVNGGESSNGDTNLSGVKVYAGDVLIAESDQYGIFIEYIFPGTEITLVKEGFHFKIRNVGEMENDSYTITGYEPALFEFRGYTDDPDILLK